MPPPWAIGFVLAETMLYLVVLNNVIDPAEAARCKVPDFAKALGHEEKWKLHNNCK